MAIGRLASEALAAKLYGLLNAGERADPDLARLHLWVDVPRLNMAAFVATEAIPGTPVRVGNFLLLGYSNIQKRHLKAIRSRGTRISRSCFPTISENIHRIRIVVPLEDQAMDTEGLARKLLHGKTRRGKDEIHGCAWGRREERRTIH